MSRSAYGFLLLKFLKIQKIEKKNQNQSCQKDNIARRRQPYVNSNNK